MSFLIYIHVYMCVQVPVEVSRAHRIPLELELQVTGSQAIWVIGIWVNGGPLQEHQALLAAEPSLHSP